jgi:membrane-associated phospholipid phosphatase
MKKIAVLLLIANIICIFGTGTGYAANEEHALESGELSLNADYFRGYITDTKDIVTSPSRWNRKAWVKASIVAGVTLGLFAVDDEINEWIQDNRHDDVAKFAVHFGDGKIVLPPLALFYAVAHVTKNYKAKRAALLTFENVAITGLFTQIVKISFHRHRPNSGDSSSTWDGPGFNSDNLSFPSGHTSLAFSIATPIATEYKDNIIIPPLAYGLASLVGWSRMNDNKHWASDVFIGASLGYFTGKAVCMLHSKGNESRFTILPVPGRTPSVTLLYRY